MNDDEEQEQERSGTDNPFLKVWYWFDECMEAIFGDIWDIAKFVIGFALFFLVLDLLSKLF